MPVSRQVRPHTRPKQQRQQPIEGEVEEPIQVNDQQLTNAGTQKQQFRVREGRQQGEQERHIRGEECYTVSSVVILVATHGHTGTTN